VKSRSLHFADDTARFRSSDDLRVCATVAGSNPPDIAELKVPVLSRLGGDTPSISKSPPVHGASGGESADYDHPSGCRAGRNAHTEAAIQRSLP
jgi:hypothetical protein